MKYKRTQKEYAEQYDCEPRTIRNWMARKLPLDDPGQMGEILATQHHGATGAQPVSVQEAKLKKVILECERLQQRIDIEKKAVVRLTEVETWIQGLAAAVGSALDVIVADAPNWTGMPPVKAQARAMEVKRRIVDELHASPGKLLRTA